MFKKVALVVALFPAVVFASVQKEPLVSLTAENIDKTYVCQKYNDNHLNEAYEYVGEDSGVLLAEQTIHQNNSGFIIDKNVVFPDGLSVDNPVGGSITGMAGNGSTVFFKRSDLDGKTYFVVYLTQGKNEAPNRVMYIADCEKK